MFDERALVLCMRRVLLCSFKLVLIWRMLLALYFGKHPHVVRYLSCLAFRSKLRDLVARIHSDDRAGFMTTTRVQPIAFLWPSF